MALFPINVDYTDKDFDSLAVRLRAVLTTAFPEWSEETVANFGNVLLEMFCFVGDVLGFYLDNHAQESRIVTATQRRSLIALCKLLGFEPPTAQAATVELRLSIPTVVAGSVTIPEGTVCSTLDVVNPVEFQLLADAVIPAGQLSVLVDAEQSSNAEDVFESDGLPDQEFTLAATPYLDGSAVVLAGNGSYTEVGNFLASTSGDRHYVLFVDQDGRAHIRFGSGTLGQVPAPGTVTVSYKTGGGDAGNVEPGTIQRIEGSFTDAFSTSVTVSVTNPTKASSGANAMTNAQIKVSAPASIRAPRNSISREDFVINAKRVTGVARALMLTSNEDGSVGENTGDLYIVPRGGGLPTSTLKNDVTTMVTVTYPPPLTFRVTTRDPVYKDVNVTAVIFLARGAVPAEVKAAVVANLTALFAIENADGSENSAVDFGANLLDETGTVTGLLAFSDAFNAVRDALGVVRVGPGQQDFLLNDEHDDVLLAPREFPRLGTVTLINGLTGAAI